MNLHLIHEELLQVADMVDGWKQHEDMAVIERDLALEKLRQIYAELRFAEAEAKSAVEVTAAPAEPAVSAIPVVPVVPEVQPAMTEPEPEPEQTLVAPDEVEEVEIDLEAPLELGEEYLPERMADEPMPDTFEPDVEVDLEAADVDFEVAPEPAMEVESEPEPEVAPAAMPEPTTEPAPASQPSAAEQNSYSPSLFGEEAEAVMRHRHKQRVIMSLYDSESPAPAPKHKTALKPAPEFDPIMDMPSPADFIEPTELAKSNVPAETAATTEPAEPTQVDEELDDPFEVYNVEPTYLAAEPEQEPAQEPTQPAAQQPATPEAAPAQQPAEQPAPQTLGEALNPHVQTLSDSMAPLRDMASELRRNERIDDLRQAIGINDKFLMIRDLFEGDAAIFEATIAELNRCESLDDCMIYIAENFAWSPDTDGAQLLMELLERKFAE